MKRQRMNNKGFTLIEATVAMLVMMVVGLSASSLFLYAVRYNSGASQRSVAMAVAQQRLEVLRGSDYGDAGLAFGVHPTQTVIVNPSVTATPTPTPTAGGGTGSAPVSSNTFQIQTEVVPFPIGASVASATQKRITIRVVPVNGNGNNSWANQNPVEIIFHRSSGTPGPYKQ